MRSVVLTKFVPFPADSGGKLRSLATLRLLASLGPVTLLAFADGREDFSTLSQWGITVRAFRRPSGLPALLRGLRSTGSLSAARFWSSELASALREVSVGTDLLYVNYAQLTPYALGVEAPRRILDLHNVESGLVVSYARRGLRPTAVWHRLEAARLRKIETAAAATFDTVVVVSEREAARLPCTPRQLLVCPNGWDPTPAPPPAPTPTASFTALMGWAPNVDAARWLVKRVWPRVRRRVPGARLLLVGRDPAPAVRALQAPDIEVTGTVPDVRPHLAVSRVCLAPLRAGGGSRLKILEALDAGRPVVATSVGADGLEDLVGRGLVVADTPAAFADATSRLLLDQAEAATLGAAGKAAVNERYSWQRTLDPLRSWLEKIG